MTTDEPKPTKNGVSLRDYVEYRFNELGKKVDGLVTDVQSLQITRAELAGKASQTSVIVAYVLAAIGVLLNILDRVVK
jgi:hypothetical protein